jgi:predicted SAM-dependent methyltransferase
MSLLRPGTLRMCIALPSTNVKCGEPFGEQTACGRGDGTVLMGDLRTGSNPSAGGDIAGMNVNQRCSLLSNCQLDGEAYGRTDPVAALRPRLRAICRRAYYFGFRFKCPFCCSRLRTFLPYGPSLPVLKEKKVIGGGYRDNAVCPMCASRDRERLLYLFLLNKTNVFAKPLRLLHVAPEARVNDKLRQTAALDYLTADISSQHVMVEVDITQIQFPDDSFDAIICNHVLEHVVNDQKAMSELYRILKPGGWAILQVPLSTTLKRTYEDFSITSTEGREKAFGQGDHVRIYAEDYKDRLARAGFKVNVFKWFTEPENFGGRRNAFGLNKEEGIFSVTKNP